jgi:hypothetical protein
MSRQVETQPLPQFLVYESLRGNVSATMCSDVRSRRGFELWHVLCRNAQTSRGAVWTRRCPQQHTTSAHTEEQSRHMETDTSSRLQPVTLHGHTAKRGNTRMAFSDSLSKPSVELASSTAAVAEASSLKGQTPPSNFSHRICRSLGMSMKKDGGKLETCSSLSDKLVKRKNTERA